MGCGSHLLPGWSKPVLALDLYEHSYHMDYGAKAAAYVDAYMNNINWQNASALYEQNAR
jgi:superoxide dismutase, Fe-Mn family